MNELMVKFPAGYSLGGFTSGGRSVAISTDAAGFARVPADLAHEIAQHGGGIVLGHLLPDDTLRALHDKRTDAMRRRAEIGQRLDAARQAEAEARAALDELQPGIIAGTVGPEKIGKARARAEDHAIVAGTLARAVEEIDAELLALGQEIGQAEGAARVLADIRAVEGMQEALAELAAEVLQHAQGLAKAFAAWGSMGVRARVEHPHAPGLPLPDLQQLAQQVAAVTPEALSGDVHAALVSLSAGPLAMFRNVHKEALTR